MNQQDNFKTKTPFEPTLAAVYHVLDWERWGYDEGLWYGIVYVEDSRWTHPGITVFHIDFVRDLLDDSGHPPGKTQRERLCSIYVRTLGSQATLIKVSRYPWGTMEGRSLCDRFLADFKREVQTLLDDIPSDPIGGDLIEALEWTNAFLKQRAVTAPADAGKGNMPTNTSLPSWYPRVKKPTDLEDERYLLALWRDSGRLLVGLRRASFIIPEELADKVAAAGVVEPADLTGELEGEILESILHFQHPQQDYYPIAVLTLDHDLPLRRSGKYLAAYSLPLIAQPQTWFEAERPRLKRAFASVQRNYGRPIAQLCMFNDKAVILPDCPETSDDPEFLEARAQFDVFDKAWHAGMVLQKLQEQIATGQIWATYSVVGAQGIDAAPSQPAELERQRAQTTAAGPAPTLPAVTDPTDQRILDLVTKDPDLTDQEIGQKIGMARQNVSARRRRLKAMGYKVR